MVTFKFFVQFTTYGTLYCVLVIAVSASCLAMELRTERVPADSRLIAGVALAAFFGLFAFTMTATSLRYVLLNMTSVDMLRSGTKVYQLAVRVPRGTRSTDNFTTVSYPLPKLELGINGEANKRLRPGTNAGNDSSDGSRPNARDALATRTFAILRTEPGENPWHLGYWGNWKSVMGSHVIDWLLPIRKSPCVNHEGHEGFYRMGPILADIRARYGLVNDETIDENAGLEMRQIRG
ncbi:Palmitoyltransferase pfa5 [Diatrype stigma]|uniref:Palmitoyltransferase pfa5 n=1 Tax=Diatrype stigma TaxID=117547 RepID=A0AAN9UYF9_9PEZI